VTYGRRSLENVNLLGAVVGAAAAMATAALWYSPVLFENRWQALIDKRPEEMGSPVVSMVVATIMFLVRIGLSWIVPDDASIGVSASSA